VVSGTRISVLGSELIKYICFSIDSLHVQLESKLVIIMADIK